MISYHSKDNLRGTVVSLRLNFSWWNFRSKAHEWRYNTCQCAEWSPSNADMDIDRLYARLKTSKARRAATRNVRQKGECEKSGKHWYTVLWLLRSSIVHLLTYSSSGCRQMTMALYFFIRMGATTRLVKQSMANYWLQFGLAIVVKDCNIIILLTGIFRRLQIKRTSMQVEVERSFLSKVIEEWTYRHMLCSEMMLYNLRPGHWMGTGSN